MTTPTPIIEALERIRDDCLGDRPKDPEQAWQRATAHIANQKVIARAALASLKSPPIDLDPNGGVQEKIGRYELALSTIAKGKMVVEQPWSAETAQAIAVECLQDVASLTPTGHARSEGRERALIQYIAGLPRELRWTPEFTRYVDEQADLLSSLPPEPACSSATEDTDK